MIAAILEIAVSEACSICLPPRMQLIQFTCSNVYGSVCLKFAFSASLSYFQITFPAKSLISIVSLLHDPLVPWMNSLTLFAQPSIWRHILCIWIPFSIVKSTLKLSYWSPVIRRWREPKPTALTGFNPLNQVNTSILCTCCSTIWSPESHFQFTQSLIIYSQSFHPG